MAEGESIGVGTDSFEVELSTDEIGAVCHRLNLLPPAALQGSDVIRDIDPDREPVFTAAWQSLEERHLVGASADVPLAAAIGLLGDPDVLVTIHRQSATRIDTCFISVRDGDAAEHRPVGPDEHDIAAFGAGRVAERIAAFCGLSERPVPTVGSASLTAAELLAVTEHVADGENEAALAIAAHRPDAAAAQAFVNALRSREVSAQVSITHYTAPGRLEGTSTAWLDGGPAGLWRIPRPNVSPLTEAERSDAGELDGIVVEVSPVTVADLFAEMFDGFAQFSA